MPAPRRNLKPAMKSSSVVNKSGQYRGLALEERKLSLPFAAIGTDRVI